MNKPNIILIGGGGHCKACIDVIEQENKYTIAGIIDVPEKVGQTILDYPIIGSDEDLPKIAEKYDNFIITLGQIKTPNIRIELYTKIKALGKALPTIISPLAHVSKHSVIGEGTIIMHHAIVNSACKIGYNCIINSKALIEHDVMIQNHCHISTGTIVNGGVIIGAQCTLGSNSSIKENINITDNVTVGIGTVIIKNINQAGVYVGVPAKMRLN